MSCENDHPIIDPNEAQRASVRRGIAQFQARLQAADAVATAACGKATTVR
jgi:hypothetical protein